MSKIQLFSIYLDIPEERIGTCEVYRLRSMKAGEKNLKGVYVRTHNDFVIV